MISGVVREGALAVLEKLLEAFERLLPSAEQACLRRRKRKRHTGCRKGSGLSAQDVLGKIPRATPAHVQYVNDQQQDRRGSKFGRPRRSPRRPRVHACEVITPLSTPAGSATASTPVECRRQASVP